MRKVHWTELIGNRLKFRVHRAMLTPDGYRVKTLAPVIGGSKKEKIPVEIHFDEDYVIEKLARLLEDLQPQRYNEFQSIISKAYDRWKQKRKEQDGE